MVAKAAPAAPPPPVAASDTPLEMTLFSLWPKQRIAFDLMWNQGVNQLLYGGALGGAKSHWLRFFACYVAVAYPGSTFAIFRKLDLQLKENHIKKWMKEIHPYIGGRWVQGEMEYRWPSPEWCWCPKTDSAGGKAICDHSSTTVFRHVDAETGVEKHQGASYAAMGPDEATHLAGFEIEYLLTRCRPDGDEIEKDIPGPDGRMYHYPGWPGWHQMQALTANPGGVGQDWMYSNFVDPLDGIARFPEYWEDKELIDGPHPLTNDQGEQVWRELIIGLDGKPKWITVDVRGGQTWTILVHLDPPYGDQFLKRAFVPAKLIDNPAVDADKYAAGVAIGSAEQKSRFLDGDWSYTEDAVFAMLDRDIHVVEASRIFGNETRPPLNWPRGIGQDHGTTKPTACAWVTIEEEGYLICYREYYVANKSVGEHVVAIRNLMLEDGHVEIQLAGDPRMDHKSIGIGKKLSLNDVYRHGGEPAGTEQERKVQRREAGIKIKGSRITDDAAESMMADLLEPDPSRPFPDWHPKRGETGSPLLFFTEEVKQGFREMQNLRHPEIEDDGRYGEGIKDGQPDHFYDAIKRVAPEFHVRMTRGKSRMGRFQLR